MTVLSFILLIPVFAYALQVISWYVQWIKTDEFEASQLPSEGVSVVIPFKDEEANMLQLIQSLEQQCYTNWELILVNDNSGDKGASVALELLAKSHLKAQLIQSTGVGKKTALLEGVKVANNALLVTSDADCTFHPEWLTTLTSAFIETHADLLIAPVAIKSKKGLLNRFQQIDFAAVQLSGAAAALQQKPIMCNGANLMCAKEDYLIAKLNPQIASGDDMFLLEWMKQKNKSIHFIKSGKALVETKAISTVLSFLHQRARWAAKAPHYRDKQIILTGVIVGAVNSVVLLSFLCAFWLPQFWRVFGISLFVKSTCDYMLLKAGAKDFKFNISLFEVLFWQLIYPVYVMTVILFPLVVKVKWKSRSI